MVVKVEINIDERGDYIHFFGTTGNKDIFFKNIRQAGGLLFNIDKTRIIIDPGVNTFYKYINSYQDEKIDGIILSHIHIDHSNDLNIFVELMTNEGEYKTGTLILPNQAIEERILQPYVRDFPKEIYITKPNPSQKLVCKNPTIILAITFFILRISLKTLKKMPIPEIAATIVDTSRIRIIPCCSNMIVKAIKIAPIETEIKNIYLL